MTGEPDVLEAGALRCVLDGADARDFRVGEQRVLTRLYIAVRDESWNTIPFETVQKSVERGAESFKVELSCAVDQPPVRAEWEVMIEAKATGEFEYALRGRALSSFRFNKIGLNLHHPLPETLGARYVARRGSQVATGVVPGLVDPQLFVDGKLTGMFMPYDELVLQSAADDEVIFRFSGDEFEMQDHRNWTDYNLKSYSTPLEIPLPMSAEPGQTFEQTVVVDLRGARGYRAPSQAPGELVARLDVDRERIARLPRIGSEFPDEVGSLDARVASLIGRLSLDYVRLNLDLTSDEGVDLAARKARQLEAVGRPVELVLVVSRGEARPAELARLRQWLADVPPALERVVVLDGPRGFFDRGTTTSGDKVRAYREVVEQRCGPTLLVSATDQFFAELNRWWPGLAGVDGVGYTVCPQVHAADDVSLMENSLGQADTVTTARVRSGGGSVHVTSVAMIGKYGPYPAGVPDVPLLSTYGDPRQRELFGASWTLSSLRQLVDSEAMSGTYFELLGERGLVGAAEDGSPEPLPFPVYRVLETVLSWEHGNLVRIGPVAGPDTFALGIVGLGAEWPDRSELLIANLTQGVWHVELSGLSGALAEAAELTAGVGEGSVLGRDGTARVGLPATGYGRGQRWALRGGKGTHVVTIARFGGQTRR